MVYYVGPVGEGRSGGSFMFKPEDLAWWISQGGTKEDWDLHHAAGYVRRAGTWAYRGSLECDQNTPYTGDAMERLKAMAECNQKDKKKSSKDGDCCCDCEKESSSGEKTTPSGGSGLYRGSFASAGGGSWMGPSFFSHSFDDDISTPEQRASAAAQAMRDVLYSPSGEQIESGGGEKHGKDCCCCCCCPCPEEQFTYTKSNVITDDPVRVYSGMSISTSSYQPTGHFQPSGQLGMQQQMQSGFPSGGSVSMPRVISVPGSVGALTSPTRSFPTTPTTTTGGGSGCGCTCKGQTSKAERPMTKALPAESDPLFDPVVEPAAAGGGAAARADVAPGADPAEPGPAAVLTPLKVAPGLGGPAAPEKVGRVPLLPALSAGLALPEKSARIPAAPVAASPRELVASAAVGRFEPTLVAATALSGGRVLGAASSASGEEFGRFASDLLADVMAVSRAASPRISAVPEVGVDILAVVRATAAAVLPERFTLSGS